MPAAYRARKRLLKRVNGLGKEWVELVRSWWTGWRAEGARLLPGAPFQRSFPGRDREEAIIRTREPKRCRVQNRNFKPS